MALPGLLKLISTASGGEAILKPKLQEIATYGAVNATTNTTPFLKNGLLALSSGTVAGFAGATNVIGVGTIWGMAQNASRGLAGSATRQTLTPPDALQRDFQYAIELRGCIVEMTLAGATAAFDSSLTTGGALTGAIAPGTQLSLSQQGSGSYIGYIFGSTSGTKVCEVVRTAPGTTTTESNPRVWVRFLDTAFVA